MIIDNIISLLKKSFKVFNICTEYKIDNEMYKEK